MMGLGGKLPGHYRIMSADTTAPQKVGAGGTVAHRVLLTLDCLVLWV